MFIKDDKDTSKLIDNVFILNNDANKKIALGNKEVINSTLGTLYDENGKLVTLNSFYDIYNNLNNIDYAKYANVNGNKEFKKLINSFILENKINKLFFDSIPTSGGTGAINIAIKNFLNINEIILIPDIGWSNYSLIAKEENLKIVYYKLFDENNHFTLNDLKNKISYSLEKQNKAFIILNTPSNNPIGYSFNENNHQNLVNFINTKITGKEKEVIILNDIAYIDYSFDIGNSRNYFKIYDSLNKNALLLIAYSCSKSFTIYGLRLGVLLFANQDKPTIKLIHNILEKSCRATWSNVNNSALITITELLKNNKNKYLLEKDKYINLLKERANIFLKESQEANLEIYPYDEGFFITLKLESFILDKYHQELINNNIYTLKTNNGIRIAICSIPKASIVGLAKRLKNILIGLINTL